MRNWTELTKECNHEVSKMRHAFLLEHQKADEILMSKEGIPLSATYYTPELPGYGKTRTDVPMTRPVLQDVEALEEEK